MQPLERKRAAVAAHQHLACPAVEDVLLSCMCSAPRRALGTFYRWCCFVALPNLGGVHVQEVPPTEVRVAVVAPHIREHPVTLLTHRRTAAEVADPPSLEFVNQHGVHRQGISSGRPDGCGTTASWALDCRYFGLRPEDRRTLFLKLDALAFRSQLHQASVAVGVTARQQPWHSIPTLLKRCAAQIAVQGRGKFARGSALFGLFGGVRLGTGIRGVRRGLRGGLGGMLRGRWRGWWRGGGCHRVLREGVPQLGGLVRGAGGGGEKAGRGGGELGFGGEGEPLLEPLLVAQVGRGWGRGRGGVRA
eukprot:Sspe_Gene.39106::Locus_18872_Transcript_1_1_Confidence_1.000_Length_1514::g.39106::m.39106